MTKNLNFTEYVDIKLTS